MSELARFHDIVIAVFFRDVGKHKRPHVHARYAEHAASVAINNGAVLDGKLPRPAMQLVRAWLKRNQVQVWEAWRLASTGKAVGKIGKRKKGGR